MPAPIADRNGAENIDRPAIGNRLRSDLLTPLNMTIRTYILALLILVFAGCATPVVISDASRWTIEVASSDAKPSGLIRIYDDMGRLMLEGSLISGQMDGTWTAWSSQKDRLAEWSYRAGVRNGPVKMWYGRMVYPDALGRLKLEGTFHDGNFDGPVTRYHATGSRRTVRIYEQGKIISAQCWAPDGTEQPPGFTTEVAAEEHKGDMLYLGELEGIVTRSLVQAHRRIQ